MWLPWSVGACVVATALGQQPANGSQEAADRQELTRLETVWNDAHMRGDAAALDRLWADDLTVAVPNMPVFTKADTIRIWRTAQMKFQRYETSDVSIRLYGDAAVVTGRLERSRTFDNRTVDDRWRFTKVYVRRDGRWQVVAFHASTAAP